MDSSIKKIIPYIKEVLIRLEGKVPEETFMKIANILLQELQYQHKEPLGETEKLLTEIILKHEELDNRLVTVLEKQDSEIQNSSWVKENLKSLSLESKNIQKDTKDLNNILKEESDSLKKFVEENSEKIQDFTKSTFEDFKTILNIDEVKNLKEDFSEKNVQLKTFIDDKLSFLKSQKGISREDITVEIKKIENLIDEKGDNTVKELDGLQKHILDEKKQLQSFMKEYFSKIVPGIEDGTQKLEELQKRINEVQRLFSSGKSVKAISEQEKNTVSFDPPKNQYEIVSMLDELMSYTRKAKNDITSVKDDVIAVSNQAVELVNMGRDQQVTTAKFEKYFRSEIEELQQAVKEEIKKRDREVREELSELREEIKKQSKSLLGIEESIEQFLVNQKMYVGLFEDYKKKSKDDLDITSEEIQKYTNEQLEELQTKSSEIFEKAKEELNWNYKGLLEMAKNEMRIELQENVKTLIEGFKQYIDQAVQDISVEFSTILEDKNNLTGRIQPIKHAIDEINKAVDRVDLRLLARDIETTKQDKKVTIYCPHCDKEATAPSSFQGKRVMCSSCKEEFTFPSIDEDI